MSSLTKTNPISDIAWQIGQAAYEFNQFYRQHGYTGVIRKVGDYISDKNTQFQNDVADYLKRFKRRFGFKSNQRFPLYYPHYRKKVPVRLFMVFRGRKRSRVGLPFVIGRRRRPWRARRYRYRRWF